MSEKSDNSAHQAASAASAAITALVIFGVCVAAFLPPLYHTVSQSLALTILAGLGIAVSCILHLIFVGVTAHRMGRSAARWVILALLLFPVGSIIGLIVLNWLHDEKQQTTPGPQ
ncbi:MAG: hypothetical protein V4488_24195 [Pseudomonadota bacterium]